jgi:hypothetical protein
MLRIRSALFGLALSTTPFTLGCGGADDPQANLKQQAGGKLAAMQQLADAVARNADHTELSGLVEVFTSNTLDVKANPDEAKQIVEIYNTKVKGKLRGELANQMNGMVNGIEKELKK